jgi:hypothetical protein
MGAALPQKIFQINKSVILNGAVVWLSLLRVIIGASKTQSSA